MGNRRWTKEELEYLEEKWGNVSIKGLAKHFKRTLKAVRLKAERMGLGNFTLSGDYLTLFQLGQAMGMDKNCYIIYNKWIDEGLPIKHKAIVNEKRKIIYIEDFWEWAELHQDIVNFSRMEKNILGVEPEWVDAKRKKDMLTTNSRKYWTETEIQTLEQMLLSVKYTHADIAKALKRTQLAISSKAHDIKKDIVKNA